MVAAYCGKLEIFRYLTQIGADINIRNDNNTTALHLALELVSMDVRKLLLVKGMSVKLTNTYNSTQLHIYAQFSRLRATRTLV